MEHVAWGIIGPGTIAERFATELHASRTGATRRRRQS
jgi:hypothetical protein